MGFPDEKELKIVREKLAKAEPSYGMPENPTKAQILKYELCRKFVVYLRKNEMSQSSLAHQLDMDPARLNEIVKYRINLFTVDKLLEYATRLDTGLDIKVS